MHHMGNMMIFMWVPFLILAVLILALAIYFLRSANPKSLLVTDIASTFPNKWKPFEKIGDGTAAEASLHETIFILPDISHYTRFMTGSHFSFSHAQEIVFSLINAMIKASNSKIHLSKLEGDAALFYVDADTLRAEQVGEVVFDIFGAFFSERKRLMNSNICPCKACRHISDLDLKIFVHRGRASRFEFRGSVDHFGTDVIILHRLMKNNVAGSRYIMTTEESANCISVPGNPAPVEIEETAEGIGTVRARVYEIGDDLVKQLENRVPSVAPNVASETAKKLSFNVRTLINSMLRR